jgi:hypothetical protein
LAAVYCGLRIRRAAHPYWWTVLAGVLAGLAALVHQDGVVLVLPLAIAAWSALAARTSRIRALVAPAAMIVAFVLTIVPWMVRNAVELHRFVPISDQAGETLFGTYNPVSAADHQIPYRWRTPYLVATHRPSVEKAAKPVILVASRYPAATRAGGFVCLGVLDCVNRLATRFRPHRRRELLGGLDTRGAGRSDVLRPTSAALDLAGTHSVFPEHRVGQGGDATVPAGDRPIPPVARGVRACVVRDAAARLGEQEGPGGTAGTSGGVVTNPRAGAGA